MLSFVFFPPKETQPLGKPDFTDPQWGLHLFNQTLEEGQSLLFLVADDCRISTKTDLRGDMRHRYSVKIGMTPMELWAN